ARVLGRLRGLLERHGARRRAGRALARPRRGALAPGHRGHGGPDQGRPDPGRGRRPALPLDHDRDAVRPRHGPRAVAVAAAVQLPPLPGRDARRLARRRQPRPHAGTRDARPRGQAMRRRAGGFTLIEMVVALVLLGAMMVLLYDGLTFSLRSWDAG